METILIQVPDGGAMPKALVGDFTAICGSGPIAFYAGSMLHRMMYLHDRSTVTKDGKRWYIQSREELMRDLGMTDRMYRGALKTLQELEYVEITYMKSMTKDASLRTTAFRVTEKARVAILDRENEQTGSYNGVQTGQDDGVQTGPYVGVPTIEDSSPQDSHLSSHRALKNALEKAKQNRLEKNDSGEVKQKDVEEVWRNGVKAFDSGYYHAPWFNREKAMAKRLIKAVGEDRVLEVVKTCTTRWPEFVEEAKKSSTYRFPTKPNLGALLSHASAALTFASRPQYHHVQQGAKSLKDYKI